MSSRQKVYTSRDGEDLTVWFNFGRATVVGKATVQPAVWLSDESLLQVNSMMAIYFSGTTLTEILDDFVEYREDLFKEGGENCGETDVSFYVK